MGKRGPKKRYETPAEFKAAVNQYIDKCNEAGIFPDLAGMRLELGISERTLCRYMEGDSDTAREFRDVMDYAKDVRESWLVRKMTSDNKAAQGCLNALKQPSNGGYVDRPPENITPKIEINVIGVGGESAFK